MTVLDQIVERTRERLLAEGDYDRRAAQDVAASRAGRARVRKLAFHDGDGREVSRDRSRARSRRAHGGAA